MKFPTILFSIIILISCQKDISKQFIQPPKYKGEDMSDVFPYVKYTSVKTFEINKPDTLFYNNRSFSREEYVAFADSLLGGKTSDEAFDDESVDLDEYMKNSRLLEDIYWANLYEPTFETEQLTPNSKYYGKLKRKEIQQLSEMFRTSNIRFPQPKCSPMYRDIIVFYNEDEKAVAKIFICFTCNQILLSPESKQHIRTDWQFWNELSAFLEQKGHDVTYGKRLKERKF